MESTFTLLGTMRAAEKLRAFGSGGDCSGTTPGEIVAPQRDGEADDGEPGYDDCPRLRTKPLEPLAYRT